MRALYGEQQLGVINVVAFLFHIPPSNTLPSRMAQGTGVSGRSQTAFTEGPSRVCFDILSYASLPCMYDV